jgi:hypothetical protein
MSQNRTFLGRKVMSGAVPWGGDDAPWARQASLDSHRLRTIMARLAMRATETKEVIDNPQM